MYGRLKVVSLVGVDGVREANTSTLRAVVAGWGRPELSENEGSMQQVYVLEAAVQVRCK